MRRLGLALLAILSARGAGRVPWPAELARATAAGCTCQEVHPREDPTAWWHTRVWIQMPGHRWNYLYSIRGERLGSHEGLR